MDGRGVPLSLIVTGANRHDVSQLARVLDAVILAKQVYSPALARVRQVSLAAEVFCLESFR